MKTSDQAYNIANVYDSLAYVYDVLANIGDVDFNTNANDDAINDLYRAIDIVRTNLDEINDIIIVNSVNRDLNSITMEVQEYIEAYSL